MRSILAPRAVLGINGQILINASLADELTLALDNLFLEVDR